MPLRRLNLYNIEEHPSLQTPPENATLIGFVLYFADRPSALPMLRGFGASPDSPIISAQPSRSVDAFSLRNAVSCPYPLRVAGLRGRSVNRIVVRRCGTGIHKRLRAPPCGPLCMPRTAPDHSPFEPTCSLFQIGSACFFPFL